MCASFCHLPISCWFFLLLEDPQLVSWYHASAGFGWIFFSLFLSCFRLRMDGFGRSFPANFRSRLAPIFFIASFYFRFHLTYFWEQTRREDDVDPRERDLFKRGGNKKSALELDRAAKGQTGEEIWLGFDIEVFSLQSDHCRTSLFVFIPSLSPSPLPLSYIISIQFVYIGAFYLFFLRLLFPPPPSLPPFFCWSHQSCLPVVKSFSSLVLFVQFIFFLVWSCRLDAMCVGIHGCICCHTKRAHD